MSIKKVSLKFVSVSCAVMLVSCSLLLTGCGGGSGGAATGSGPAPVGPTPPTPPTPTPASASNIPVMPFFDVSNDLDQKTVVANTLKGKRLAFIVSDPATGTQCKPAWAGLHGYTPSDDSDNGKVFNQALLKEINTELANDPTNSKHLAPVISFGGANGSESADCMFPDKGEVAGASVQTLEDYYKHILDYYYGSKHEKAATLDFDIEGGAVFHTKANDRRFQALSDLIKQGGYPDLQVWLTLPVDNNGLSGSEAWKIPTSYPTDGVTDLEASGKTVVYQAIHYGILNNGGINLMDMDFGGPYADMAEGVIAGIVNTYNFMHDTLSKSNNGSATTWLANSADLWKHLAVTPMIGKNDSDGEWLSLGDAVEIRKWLNHQSVDDPVITSNKLINTASSSESKNLSFIGFWSSNRDSTGIESYMKKKADSAGLFFFAAASPTSTGENQNPQAFYDAFTTSEISHKPLVNQVQFDGDLLKSNINDHGYLLGMLNVAPDASQPYYPCQIGDWQQYADDLKKKQDPTTDSKIKTVETKNKYFLLKNNGPALSLSSSDSSSGLCPYDQYTLTPYFEQKGDVSQWETAASGVSQHKTDRSYKQTKLNTPNASNVVVYYAENWAWISYPVAVFKGGDSDKMQQYIPTTVVLKKDDAKDGAIQNVFLINNTEEFYSDSSSENSADNNDIMMLYNKTMPPSEEIAANHQLYGGDESFKGEDVFDYKDKYSIEQSPYPNITGVSSNASISLSGAKFVKVDSPQWAEGKIDIDWKTDHDVAITWPPYLTSQGGENQYTIAYKDDTTNHKKTTPALPALGLSKVLTGLTGGHKYEITITPVTSNTNTNTNPKTISFTTNTTNTGYTLSSTEIGEPAQWYSVYKVNITRGNTSPGPHPLTSIDFDARFGAPLSDDQLKWNRKSRLMIFQEVGQKVESNSLPDLSIRDQIDHVDITQMLQPSSAGMSGGTVNFSASLKSQDPGSYQAIDLTISGKNPGAKGYWRKAILDLGPESQYGINWDVTNEAWAADSNHYTFLKTNCPVVDGVNQRDLCVRLASNNVVKLSAKKVITVGINNNDKKNAITNKQLKQVKVVKIFGSIDAKTPIEYDYHFHLVPKLVIDHGVAKREFSFVGADGDLKNNVQFNLNLGGLAAGDGSGGLQQQLIPGTLSSSYSSDIARQK